MTTSMRTCVMLFILIATLISNNVYSLPPINFTDTVLTNRMIEALNDALIGHEEQQLTPFQQLRQQLRRNPFNPQYFPEQRQQQQPYYQNQLPEQQQQNYQNQLPEQQHS